MLDEVRGVVVPRAADTRELLFTAEVVLERLDAAPRRRARAPALTAAVESLREGCAASTAALAHNHEVAAAAALDRGSSRVELIGALSPILMILDALALAKVPELAHEGRALRAEVFGVDFETRSRSARTLFSEVDLALTKLDAHPELAARLRARVPEALLAYARGVHRRLGEELGVYGPVGRPPRVSKQVLRTLLRERMTQVVRRVAAAALLGDEEEVAEARHQLAPVVALAASVRPRRRRAPMPELLATTGSSSSTPPAPASAPSTPGGWGTASPAASPARSPSADRPASRRPA